MHALVLGLAKSGTAAATILLKNKVHVRINDYNTKPDAEIVTEFRRLGAEVVVGSHPLSVLEGIDIIVKNPGIPYSNDILKEAEARRIPIITEIELAASLASDNNMIGITGSNGKTTTTSLVYQMLEASERRTKLAGNIGVVATEVAETLEEDDLLLLELSSFQLMGVQQFKPHVVALLNLFDAHLDYHGSVDAYIAAKKNIFINQTEDDYLVYNLDDQRVVTAIEDAKAVRLPFSTVKQHIDGAWLDNNYMYFKDEKIIDLQDIVLVGDHNKENILAAIAVALMMGATKTGIHHVLTTFTGLSTVCNMWLR